MRFIDLHCDTIGVKIANSGGARVLRQNDGHLDLVRMKAAGALAQFFAIFIPIEGAAERYGITENSYEFFNRCYAVYQEEMAKNSDLILSAYCYQDILRNQVAGKMSSILTIEEGHPVMGDMAKIKEFYDKGVRLITLTWNYENCFGFPNSDEEDKMKLGLKPFGIDAVRYMNELGVIIDVSHLSEGGFYDVARYSSKPFMASHSCCRVISSHKRNLWDDQLRKIGETGSVVGVNFAAAFMHERGDDITTVDDVIKHMLHIKNVAGMEAVAFGSDFDGIGSTMEFVDYAGMPIIERAMEHHFTPREIDLINNGNAIRLIKEVL